MSAPKEATREAVKQNSHRSISLVSGVTVASHNSPFLILFISVHGSIILTNISKILEVMVFVGGKKSESNSH